jgi:hypothetical protein
MAEQDATARYRALVVEDEQTCYACPTQWEGRLTDGRYFYFRYRGGWASLALGDSAGEVAGRCDHEMQIGGYFDGSMDDGEYHKTFLSLLVKAGG